MPPFPLLLPLLSFHRGYQIEGAEAFLKDLLAGEMEITETAVYVKDGVTAGRGYRVNPEAAVIKLIGEHFQNLQAEGKPLPTHIR